MSVNDGPMRYRLLAKDELPRLAPLMRRYHYTINPETTLASVAENDAGIFGTLLLQMVWHLEPLIILAPNIDFRRLIKPIEYVLPRGISYYSFADTDKVAEMCKINGMSKLDYQVFLRTVGETV